MNVRRVVLGLSLFCCLPLPLAAQMLPEGQIASVEERRILVALEEEYAKLSDREAEIERREIELKTLAAEVDKKLAAMQELRQELLKLLDRKQQAEQQRLVQLAAIYEKMEPAKAATLISELDQRQAIALLLGIKEKIAGKILDNLDPKIATELSRAFNKTPVRDKSGY